MLSVRSAVPGGDGRFSDVLLIADADRRLEEAVAAGERPRVDYLELAAALNARYPTRRPTRRFDRALSRVPPNWLRAWRMRADRPGTVLALAEDAGFAVTALAPRGTRQVVIAHNLTSRRERVLAERTGWLRRPDCIVVLAKPQERYLRERAGLPADRVCFVHDKVDHRFFVPSPDRGDDGFVLSVGAEARDYGTLLDALRRLQAPAVLVPSSQWVSAHGVRELPSGVTLRSDLSFAELRELYAAAALVVVSVRPGVQYAAGVNAILEAMAMGKPLVVTRTPGLEGYLDDGETMRTVPAGDPAALATAIDGLRTDPAHGRRLGRSARRVIDAGRNLDTYVADVAACVRAAAPPGPDWANGHPPQRTT